MGRAGQCDTRAVPIDQERDGNDPESDARKLQRSQRLIEKKRGGLTHLVDRVLVVDCPEEAQIARVARRSALAEGEVRAIMATQLQREERLAAADDVLDNSGPVAGIALQVEKLDQRYRRLAVAPRADASPPVRP